MSGRNGVVSVDQTTIGGSRRSNPATGTGPPDPIRTAFAKANGVQPTLFSANPGAPASRNGAGVIYKELHHRCGVYACWNPDHLELVSHAENQWYLRKTLCKHGHPLSGDNLRIGPNGVRACRACNAANQRAFRERHERRGL